MEPQTRSLTIEEMYFKKPAVLHLPGAGNQKAIPVPQLESGGVISSAAHNQGVPKMDLTDPVFHPSSFSEKAGKFITKNWPLLLLGAVIIAGGIIIYRNHKKKKEENSPSLYPNDYFG